MKPLVIYHADCTDGFGAAFAAWTALRAEAQYASMHYGDVEAPVNLIGMFGDHFHEREVYILDFSFSREVMDWLFNTAPRVVWLDHHKTAFEMWCGKYEKGMHYTTEDVATKYGDRVLIRLDDNKSGALLAWEWFSGTEVPQMIKHIDDRDRWQWKMEGSAEIHAALQSYQPWSFGQWSSFVSKWRSVSMPYGELILNDGQSILRAQKQHVESMVEQARKCVIKDFNFEAVCTGSSYSGLAVNAPIHQSEVGHELANASGTFGLVWYVGSDNTVRCSLRSNGEYDVSAIARAFGGGGHRNAAGFSTDIETLMGWLK